MEAGNDIVYKNGALYICGGFCGNNTEFNPGTGPSYKFSAYGQADPFVAKYDILGNINWAFGIRASTSVDNATALDLDNNDNVYVTGNFSYSADFDGSPDTALITSNGGEDIFLAKYDKSGNYINAFTDVFLSFQFFDVRETTTTRDFY